MRNLIFIEKLERWFFLLLLLIQEYSLGDIQDLSLFLFCTFWQIHDYFYSRKQKKQRENRNLNWPIWLLINNCDSNLTESRLK